MLIRNAWKNIEKLNEMNRIPNKFTVGGQDINVKQVDFCENSDLGNIILGQG